MTGRRRLAPATLAQYQIEAERLFWYARQVNLSISAWTLGEFSGYIGFRQAPVPRAIRGRGKGGEIHSVPCDALALPLLAYRLAFGLPLVLSARRTRWGQWKGVRSRTAIWQLVTGLASPAKQRTTPTRRPGQRPPPAWNRRRPTGSRTVTPRASPRG
ncbi:hypothetical protein B0G76_8437 [Paraburkholderia sp. BL23I1N1]|uniref:hypothetical protein n=1 Tax=Paraburkholderia sp. BL23I1N1 TaxID=1938802 RepID=UPI000E743286|nr:hypothetical protein [Paraburkholderia sp. BL23I1N1]RKE23756.1 hypothetical protein B0G76_8437 [Paraburkholderia sp. BL23I1N1]